MTAPNATIALTNGAQACNIFWEVGSSATLDTATTFRARSWRSPRSSSTIRPRSAAGPSPRTPRCPVEQVRCRPPAMPRPCPAPRPRPRSRTPAARSRVGVWAAEPALVAAALGGLGAVGLGLGHRGRGCARPDQVGRGPIGGRQTTTPLLLKLLRRRLQLLEARRRGARSVVLQSKPTNRRPMTTLTQSRLVADPGEPLGVTSSRLSTIRVSSDGFMPRACCASSPGTTRWWYSANVAMLALCLLLLVVLQNPSLKALDAGVLAWSGSARFRSSTTRGTGRCSRRGRRRS